MWSGVKRRPADKSNNDYNGQRKKGEEEKGKEEGRESTAKEAHHFTF